MTDADKKGAKVAGVTLTRVSVNRTVIEVSELTKNFGSKLFIWLGLLVRTCSR